MNINLKKMKKTDGTFQIRTMPGDMLNIRRAAEKFSIQTGQKVEMASAIRHAVKLYVTDEKSSK